MVGVSILSLPLLIGVDCGGLTTEEGCGSEEGQSHDGDELLFAHRTDENDLVF